MDTAAGLPPETALGRVCLRHPETAGLVDFYRDVVGLRVLDSGGDRTTLGAGSDPVVVLDRDPDCGQRPPGAAGLYHLAVRYPDRASLGGALARVAASDVGLEGASDHGVSEALYLRDPAGNGVELYRDRPRDAWPADGDRVAMVTERLDRDALHADAADADRAPPGTDLGHVHLEVTDLDATRAFYADALGLRVRQTAPGALFFAAGDYHHHVGTNAWSGRTAPASGEGLAWVEVVVPDEAAFATARARLREAGVDPTDRGSGVAVADPDGNRLRLRAGDT